MITICLAKFWELGELITQQTSSLKKFVQRHSMEFTSVKKTELKFIAPGNHSCSYVLLYFRDEGEYFRNNVTDPKHIPNKNRVMRALS